LRIDVIKQRARMEQKRPGSRSVRTRNLSQRERYCVVCTRGSEGGIERGESAVGERNVRVRVSPTHTRNKRSHAYTCTVNFVMMHTRRQTHRINTWTQKDEDAQAQAQTQGRRCTRRNRHRSARAAAVADTRTSANAGSQVQAQTQVQERKRKTQTQAGRQAFSTDRAQQRAE